MWHVSGDMSEEKMGVRLRLVCLILAVFDRRPGKGGAVLLGLGPILLRTVGRRCCLPG